MFDLADAYVIFAGHFLGDFILQSDETSKNKSKDNRVLLTHVFQYGAPNLVVSLILFTTPGAINLGAALTWLFFNLIAHYTTDYYTSRRTSRLWSEGRVHDFFVTIGFDQMVHMLCLFTLLALIR